MIAGMLAGIVSALWLGILTSISPCPMATNLAAVSFIGRHIDSKQRVFLAGLLYTLGRAIAYSALGIFLGKGISSLPIVSHFLQKYMNTILGPLLILTGMILLNLISLNFITGFSSEKIKEPVSRTGIWGAGILGFIFALSFCPASAAIFFGSLLPLILELNSPVIIPVVYGVATGIPVLVFAAILAAGASKASKVFNKVAVFQKWAGKITGILFILIGLYLSLIHIFNVTVF